MNITYQSHGDLTERNKGVDFLRGFSILSVVCYHYMLFRPASAYGLYGVLLFFVISGYCMPLSITNCGSGWRFLLKRLFRLLPALLVCALITAFIEMALPLIPDRSQSFSSLLKTLVCLPILEWPCMVIGKANYAMVDGAYWSLRVELKFYAVLAFCYFCISCRHYFAAFMGAVLFGGAIMYWFPNLEKQIMLPNVYLSDFLPYLPYFLGGMSIYQLRNGSKTLGVVGIVYSLMSATIFLQIGIAPFSMPSSKEALLAFAGSLALIAMFVFHFDRFGLSRSWLSRGMVFLGLISYPFYLLHQDIGYILIKLLGEQWWASYLVVPVIIGTAAWGIHRYVENVLVEWVKLHDWWKMAPVAGVDQQMS